MIENQELEFAKIELEKEKLKAERSKSIWTNLSIFIPLLIAALTIAYNAWSQTQQSRETFKLKAAEIVLSADSPSAAHGKAIFLAALFNDELPPDFDENAEEVAKMFSSNFLETRIQESPEQKEALINAWLFLHPEDKDEEWLNALR